MTDIVTHELIDQNLCGRPIENGEGTARIEMILSSNMKVDRKELTHGGFVFGLADHAAMIAVNHPNVVLGASDVKFLKPTKVGDCLIAEAKVETDSGKKRIVNVFVKRGEEIVFEGVFTCFVLERHVLD